MGIREKIKAREIVMENGRVTRKRKKKNTKKEPKKDKECCSWNGETCGDTTDFCKSGADNCEKFCNGEWILINNKPKKTEKPEKPEAAKGCCSWDKVNHTCSSTSTYCRA